MFISIVKGSVRILLIDYKSKFDDYKRIGIDLYQGIESIDSLVEGFLMYRNLIYLIVLFLTLLKVSGDIPSIEAM